MIRTFIAIEIPEELRRVLAGDISLMRQVAPLVKWSQPDNLHLTLRFLGDVHENDLDELFTALSDAVEDVESFTIELANVGAFPHWRHPRVVWAGCVDGGDDVRGLAGVIEDACVELGYDPERRPFRPHLTLGRIKEPAQALGLDEAVRSIEHKRFGVVDVDDVVVFMSSLRRTGPVYSPMARIPLSGIPLR